MLSVANINQYFRSGRGRVTEFYLTDEELQHLLLTALPKEFTPYSLITHSYDGDKTFIFKEAELAGFITLRKAGYDRFYLRSLALSPAIEFPMEPVVGGKLRSDYQNYFIYNGFLDIQHGFKLEHRYEMSSSIGLIEKYYDISNPDLLFFNEGYIDIFNILKRSVKKLLKFRSMSTLRDGTVRIAASKDVSEQFLLAAKEGRIDTKIDFI